MMIPIKEVTEEDAYWKLKQVMVLTSWDLIIPKQLMIPIEILLCLNNWWYQLGQMCMPKEMMIPIGRVKAHSYWGLINLCSIWAEQIDIILDVLFKNNFVLFFPRL